MSTLLPNASDAATPEVTGKHQVSDLPSDPERAPARRRRRQRTRAVVIGGGVVLAIAGVSAAALGIGGRGTEKPARSTLPPATADVARETLVETQEVSGTLGYSNARDLSGKATGTITWLPAPGALLGRGDTVYRADEKPVVLLYGPLPMFRPLTVNLKGPDVRQFERNLRALGYRGFTVDDKYNEKTATAVKKWQKDLDLPETGTVDPSAVVVTAGQIRVAELKVQVGDAAGEAILSYTGTIRMVTIDLDVKYQHMVRKGAPVNVTLPGGETAKGVIASISPVATATEGKDGAESKSTIKVLVTVADQKSLGSYDQASVYLQFVAEERKDVLTVPVAALLALAEGGYGVEVVEAGKTRIVKVELGMFSGGKVEVKGEGLDAGTKVGVPA